MDSIVKKLRENRILQERADYSSKSRDELIELAQGGDNLAMDILIKSHQDLISRMVNKYFLKDSMGDQDDLRQVATLGLWGAITTYDPKKSGDFEAYAGMHIKGELTKALSKDETWKSYMSSQSDSMDKEVMIGSEGDSATLGDMMADKKGSAEDQAVGNMVANEIDEFMQTLKPNELNVIQLYIEGYKVSEISEELDMKYKTVEGTLARAKWKIRNFLDDRKLTDSKNVRRSMHEDIEFSEEEKDMLRASLSRIKNK